MIRTTRSAFDYRFSNAMLDTVNFKLTRVDVGCDDLLKAVVGHLNPDSIAYHDYNGHCVVTSRLDNLGVSVSPYQLRVGNGSLCKWMLGDNYHTLGCGGVRYAVERLSDTLHVPMERAVITRLDVGACVVVEQPCANYFNHLGALRYAGRFENDGSLYYYQHGRATRLCFYDKNREQRDNRESIPDCYRDVNVLRYEQRYMSRLPSVLGVERVSGAMLCDEVFIRRLLCKWHDTYRSIGKINDVSLNFQVVRSKKSLHDAGILALVERFGGELGFIAHINEARSRGELTAKQAFDLRQEVRRVCSGGGGLTIPSEAITELDEKISEVVQSYG